MTRYFAKIEFESVWIDMRPNNLEMEMKLNMSSDRRVRVEK